MHVFRRVLNIEMRKKKTELINMSTSGVGENRNTALLGRHVLGENFYRHVADGGKPLYES